MKPHVNWLRLLLCMAVTALVSVSLERYWAIHTNSAVIAGLGILVGRLCIRRDTNATS